MDLTLNIGNGKYNLRVSAIVRNGDMLLMDSLNGIVFPIGGRVKLNETIEEALNREVLEETGCTILSSKFKGIGQSTFYSQGKDAPIHEHNFIFEVELVGGVPNSLSWVPMSDDNYVPQYIKNIDTDFIHSEFNDYQFSDNDISTVVNDSVEFNVRISAIIRDGDKVLFDESAYDKKHLVPIGGRMQMGESFQEALSREVKEELGVDILKSQFLGYGEDFFELSLNEGLSKPIHFVSLVYEVEVDHDKIAFDDGCCGVWLDKNSLGDIHMKSLKNYLQ